MSRYSIEKVNNKSFKDYTYPYNNDNRRSMGDVNIFFGVNGAGKSALAQYFKQKDENSTRLFDSNYVEKNILTKQSVEGSSIIIGDTAIDLQKEIQDRRDKIQIIDEEIENGNKREKKLRESVTKRMGEIVNTQKRGFGVNIQQKSNTKKDPQKAFSLWKKESEQRVQTSAKSISELNSSIESLRLKLSIPISDISQLDDKFFSNLEQVLVTKVIKPQGEINYELVQWLKEGIRLHDLTDNDQELRCSFCGNTFSSKNRLALLQSRINNKYSKMVAEINVLRMKVEAGKKQLRTLRASFNDEDLSVINLMNNIISKLQQKVQYPEEEIGIECQEKKKVVQANERIVMLVQESRKKFNELQEEKANVERIAKKRTGELIVENSDIRDELDLISKVKEELSKNRDSHNKLAEEIGALENKKNNYDGFKKLINRQLKICGADFQLENSPSNTNGEFNIVLSHSLLENKQLSEGEVRLIAFLKFYYDLFYKIDSDDAQLKENISTIMFDDPVTSVDLNNRYFITELINELINNYISRNQTGIIIFTHSDYDFHNFAFSARKAKRFLIRKDKQNCSEVAYLEKNMFLNYSDTYKSSFQDIVNFAVTSKNKLEEFKNYWKLGNQARYVLETHARSNYELEYATQKGIGELKKFYRIEDKNQEAVSLMLNTINALSHGTSYIQGSFNEVPSKVIQGVIRTLIKLLYQKDKEHVKCMSGEYWGKLKNEIINW